MAINQVKENLKILRKKLSKTPVGVSRTLAYIGYFTAFVIVFDEITDIWPSWNYESKKAVTSTKEKFDNANKLFETLNKELKISGELQIVNLANQDKPETLFHKNYASEKNEYYTVASVSKPITALAFLLMGQKDSSDKLFLDLETPVCKFIEQYCGPRFDALRIIELLKQRSGIPPLPKSPIRFLRHIGGALFPYSLETWEGVFPLGIDVSPRSKFIYSNYNYLILSRILELHTKKNFFKAIKTIFESEDLDFHLNELSHDQLIEKRVSGYTHFLIYRLAIGLPVSVLGLGNDSSYGAGDLIFSANDLVNLFHQIVHKKPNLIESIEKFTEGGYSTGFVVDTGYDNRALLWHNGRSPGFRSFMLLDPKQKIFVVWLANAWMNQKQQKEVGGSLQNIFLEKDFQLVPSQE